MQKHPQAPSWRLIGTLGEGTFCHKPSTVSGGGKSEISKSIQDAIISGPVFIGDFEADFDCVADIINYDYSKRFRGSSIVDIRSLLSMERSLGSVIKLLTPSHSDYTDEYNAWLEEIPQHILALVFLIKRFYKPSWGDNWREHFSVDEVNGHPASELKYNGRKLVTSYLRVGAPTVTAAGVYTNCGGISLPPPRCSADRRRYFRFHRGAGSTAGRQAQQSVSRAECQTGGQL